MKRKFISALLFGALITASTSTFVSCKDYDDDITELRDQIASNATDLTSLVDEKVSNADAQIAELRKQAAELDAAYKLADEGLQKSIDEAKSYADIQAEEARKAAVESARKMVDEAVSALQQSIDAANAAIAEQGKTVAGLLEADKELQAGINAAQARADEAYTLAEQAKSLGEANATKIEALNTTLETISASMLEVKNNLEAQISVINGNVADLQKKAESQAASIQSLETQLNSLKESNDAALAALEAKDAELAQQIKDNNDAITNRLNTEVADLKKLAADNLAEAKAYTDALKLWVEGQISGINTSISSLETAYQDADKVLDKKIDDLKTDLEKKISDLQTAQGTTDGAQNNRLDALENTLKALENGNLTKFAEKVSTMETNILTLQNEVKAINANIAVEAKRLKGLVFAPTTYVDGIECIKFATLKYRDWGTDPAKWEADAAVAANKLYVIDDAQHTEEYLVNPKNADVKDIVALEFISNTATNTRAVSANAPIAVADKMEDVKIVNGVMKLNLKKTTTESFGTNRREFTIVALKATLSDKLLTEQEKAEGVKAEVYSDWARLYETSSTPYIHNKLAVDKAGKLLENAEQTIVIPAAGDGEATTEKENYSHFWSFSEAYAKGSKKDNLDRDHNYRHIAKKVYYKDKLDLYELVEVCDKDGSTYDAGKYGLGFFFDLIDYNLVNDNETSDVTNQKNFGKLDTDGHTLYSTARDNTTTENRDAIGKAPMVQVVLKDTSDINNVKVVDVRYFKIQWVDKDETVTYEPGLGNFTGDYKCSEDVSQLVLEETVNAIYTWKNMTRSEFHNSYELNNTLFATQDAAAKGTPAAANLGTITDQADWADPGQTHNLKWTISTANNAASQKEYEAGKKDIEAWGYFVSKTNPNSKILFRLSLTLDIPQMGLAEGMGKDQTMWKNGARYINPQLYTDAVYGKDGGYATTMLLGDLLKGYIKDGQTPADVTSLVNFGDNAIFVFDESKFDALPTEKDTKPGDWSTENKGMSLIYKGKVAAIIGTDGTIKLTESNNGQAGSVPTEGARLLVGHSVPVKLVDTWCSLYDDIESYNVNFIEPLKIDAPTVNVSVDDIKNGGSVSTSFEKKIVIMENFGKNSEKVYENGGVSNNTLISWYGVEAPVYDIANATTNIQKDGTIGSGEPGTLLADIKNSDGTNKYSVEVKNNTVIFYNMSGNAIGQQFQIKIPVVITTKWQVIKAYLIVTVNPSI